MFLNYYSQICFLILTKFKQGRCLGGHQLPTLGSCLLFAAWQSFGCTKAGAAADGGRHQDPGGSFDLGALSETALMEITNPWALSRKMFPIEIVC
jgi:hypothetical protein